MAEAARAAVAGMARDLDFLRLAPEPFGRAPKKSIDYAVMERTKLARRRAGRHGLVRCRQLGRRVGHSRPRRERQRGVRVSAVVLDSRNSLVRSDDSILTAVVGLDNAVVVATGDAVLVASRDKAETGQGAGRPAQGAEPARSGRAPPHLPAVGLLSGRRHRRALPGQAHRGEVRRTALAAEAFPPRRALGGGEAAPPRSRSATTSARIHENESVYIPIGGVHRLANPGKIPLELIEVQVGSYLGEDDIVRLDDVYGRG